MSSLVISKMLSRSCSLLTAVTIPNPVTRPFSVYSRRVQFKCHTNKPEFVSKDDSDNEMAKQAPNLWNVHCRNPTPQVAEVRGTPRRIRLRNRNPGKVTLMDLKHNQTVWPLSCMSRSLLPPSVHSTVMLVLPREFSSQTNTTCPASTHSDTAVPLRPLKGKSDTNPVRRFVDCVEVEARGGRGGNGRISFLSLFAVEFAGPDGGDGGHGGHVIFQASERVKDLSRVSARQFARPGGAGGTQHKAGRDATHLYVEVPPGTMVLNKEGELVADLDSPDSCFIAARGGAGGKGNAHFRTAVRRAPEIAECGAEPEVFGYILELRTMADVGLIGFPNAGKSTLLTAISRARPKVASYPFTTLAPHLGMVLYSDLTQLAVADLPGLLPGAHRNHGLGLAFLRHAQRCSVLVYVLDLAQEEPWRQLEQLKFELEQYQPGLATRPAAVLANKMDLPESEERLAELQARLDGLPAGLEVIPVSGRTGINLQHMLVRIKSLCDQQQLLQQTITETGAEI